MKILTIHSDFIEFEPKQKAIKTAEEIKSKTKKRVEDCLVVFSAAEESDEKNVEQTIEITKNEIEDIAKKVDAKKIVLYPFVHLTNRPSSPETTLKILRSEEMKLKTDNYEVYTAPFGYYKSFNISCKGHPLSELSREINTAGMKKIKENEIVSQSLKQEEKVKSEWLILTPDGKLTPAKDFSFKNHKNLEKFYKYEFSKVRGVTTTPPHVKYMRTLELVDYETGTDPGNLKYYPKGRLIKSLLEQWITNKVIRYGGMEVETPVMYDFEHPALKNYLNRFPARQYIIQSLKKKFFLRFSACFGQFLMKSNTTISYKDLPLKMYELTRYAFRLEKSGELVGLRRLRAFTMPDMHTLCKDIKSAKQEFENQFKLCMECLADLEINNYETAIRFTTDFWNDNKDFIISLAKLVNKPVLIEMWNFRYAYFDPKFEFNFVDSMDKASALPTVQIDHENAERFGIQFTDEDNKRKYPLILHASHSGGIERCMYAMLEKAYLDSKKGKNPTLPLWLSPTQVRLCTVSDKFMNLAEKIADEFEKNQIRVDIDDRVESISKKIRDAETEWIPLIIVIGEKEEKTNKLAVRFRETGKVENMEQKEIIKHVKDKTKSFPFKQLPLPRLLSKRPRFVG